MHIAVCSDEGSRKELEEKGLPPEAALTWVDSPGAFIATDADVYIDLLFENNRERIDCLASLLPKTVVVNAVTDTLHAIGQPFIRINAWPGFLKRKLTEVAIAGVEQEERAAALFAMLHWPFSMVPDQPGMVAPRVVAMIVNEAYLAYQDKVSTPAEIDLAMKLGTHYPYGPFEWGRHIGLHKIHALLVCLEETDERYRIADALTEEVKRNGYLP